MRNRLIGGVAALAIALGALAFPSAEPARAASACTGWQSSFVPPTSIRVYRTSLGRTQTVPFRAYVEKVMASEWGPTAPVAALRVGAVAVKQFAWYYAMHWRGGRDAAGRCYDVVDSSRDQLYNPARRTPSTHVAAVAATWWVSLRKSDRLFLTGYRPGTGSCTANVDGWRLYQRDAVSCVHRYGDTAETLARRFFANVSWVTPGAGDFTGDGRGDLAVLAVAPETGETTGTVFTSDAEYRAAAADGTLAGAVLTNVTGDRLLGRAAGDVTGDRRADLVQLVRTDDGIALEVMAGSDAGLLPAATWWASPAPTTESGAEPVPDPMTYRLVVTDFDGDGLADAGVVRILPALVPADLPPDTPPPAPSTSLAVAISTGTAFAGPREEWSAPLDLATSELRAGDVTGDGLADLVAATPLEAGGTALEVAPSMPDGSLGALAAWKTEPFPVEAIRVLVGDANRDGRDDVIVVRPATIDGAPAIRVIVYRGTAAGSTFSPLYFGTAMPLPLATTRLSTADLNGDGRADLVALVDRGLDADGKPLGTDAWRLASTGTAFALDAWFGDAAMRWDQVFPY